MKIDFFREHVTGPIVSIGTPFCRDGAIDYEGLRRFIDFTIQAGTKTILLTPGDSLYTVLTDPEVAEITKVTAEHIDKRVMFIAASGCWWTGKAVEYAQYARDVGADATIVFPPIRGATERDLVGYYTTVAENLPVFVLSGSLGALGVRKALNCVQLLLDEVPNIAGLKEDYCPEFIRQACLMAHDKWAIFAGGQKQTHMDMLPYGCDGFMSIHMTFKPEIAHAYWDAILKKDMPRATGIIRDYDMPIFRFLYSDFAAGGDAGLHALSEIAGICGRWRRNPLPDFTDEDMERLRAFLKKTY